MEKLPADCNTDLQKLVDMINPANILIAGGERVRELADLAAEKKIKQIETISGENRYADICRQGIFDLVMLADIESMQKKPALQLIGRVRDFHARHLLVMVSSGKNPASGNFASHWQQQDFIACGMRLFRKYVEDGHELQVYRFELSDYKITPDWFSSKFWANPELFDKYRW